MSYSVFPDEHEAEQRRKNAESRKRMDETPLNELRALRKKLDARPIPDLQKQMDKVPRDDLEPWMHTCNLQGGKLVALSKRACECGWYCPDEMRVDLKPATLRRHSCGGYPMGKDLPRGEPCQYCGANDNSSAVDNVNSPAHYASGAVECIDAIEAQLTPEEYRGYLKGNIAKYVWREKTKGGVESLKKAQWYLNRLVSK